MGDLDWHYILDITTNGVLVVMGRIGRKNPSLLAEFVIDQPNAILTPEKAEEVFFGIYCNGERPDEWKNEGFGRIVFSKGVISIIPYSDNVPKYSPERIRLILMKLRREHPEITTLF